MASIADLATAGGGGGGGSNGSGLEPGRVVADISMRSLQDELSEILSPAKQGLARLEARAADDLKSAQAAIESADAHLQQERAILQRERDELAEVCELV